MSAKQFAIVAWIIFALLMTIAVIFAVTS